MKNLIQAAVVTLFAASTAQAQQAVQWKVSDGGNGHWYARVVEPRTWSGQAQFAESVGAHLVSLTSDAENLFVHGLFPGRSWLGGFTEAGQGCNPSAWKWVTGEPWSIAPWAPPEPNYCDETRLEFSGPYPSKWNNYYDAVANRAIIEWSADCNNDGIVDYGQILDGTFADVNADGVPDACQAPCLPADLNNDGLVDGADLGVLLSNWGPTDGEAPRPDINGNGIVDGADLGVLLANWGPCGGAPAWATVVQWQPDPAVVTDDQLRSAIAATGLPWRVRDTSTQIEMLLVPPGTFQMGCIMGSSEFPGCYGNDLPVHQVALSSAFYLGRYEVTQLQWVTRMGSNPSSSYNPTYPVGNVSWNTVQGYLSATGFRLPTEAEWEYACRAGTRTPFHSGPGFQSGTTNDYLVTQIAWWDQNTSSPRPVGGKAANALGFHDMLGNMWEWVNDWYDGFTVDTQTNPMGPTIGDRRVIRGRSWNDDGQDIVGPRSSDRGSVAPDLSYITVGFRVARTP